MVCVGLSGFVIVYIEMYNIDHFDIFLEVLLYSIEIRNF